MTKAPRKNPRAKLLIAALLLCALSYAGCGPTYPKEIVDKAVVQLCREEYKIDVKVKIVANTVGVYLPIEGLFDNTLNITKEAADKINDVLLSVSRVTLSSDAPLDFYIVVAQDPVLPEVEVVLIRYVKDLKMLHYDQISRGEFAKRMLIDIKLTPQAQKEKVLRDIFGRLKIEGADDLINEYLRSAEVTSIGDIGYWNGAFFIKAIGMAEFLAMQTADRAKVRFVEDPKLRGRFKLNSIKGEYLSDLGKNFFRFDFEVEGEGGAEAMRGVMLEEAAAVLRGYKFDAFSNVEIVDTKTREVLFANSEELENFRKRKMKLEEFRRWYR